MSILGAPRIPTGHGGKPKARGAGQPPRRYTLWEWTKGYAAWIAVLPIYLVLWAYASLFGRIPNWLLRKLLRSHNATTASRPYNVRIPFNPAIPAYMRRWWKIARNAYFNCYYHIVFRSDDDTAHHDHPWWSFSIVLEGGYYEHRILAGGVHVKQWYGPGSVLFRRSGDTAHRLELEPEPWGPSDDYDDPAERPSKTIFITGPVLRRWGFHHTERWVDAYDWDDFLKERGFTESSMSDYAQQNNASHTKLNPERYRKD